MKVPGLIRHRNKVRKEIQKLQLKLAQKRLELEEVDEVIRTKGAAVRKHDYIEQRERPLQYGGTTSEEDCIKTRES